MVALISKECAPSALGEALSIVDYQKMTIKTPSNNNSLQLPNCPSIKLQKNYRKFSQRLIDSRLK
jgi:hypothetical protein